MFKIVTCMNAISIVALCFTVLMAKRHIIENSYKNKKYISVALITIAILLLEIFDAYFTFSDNLIYTIPLRIVNVIGFSLSQFVPYYLFQFSYIKKLKNGLNFLMKIPLIFVAIMSISSYFTGWIFIVDSQKQYSRGPLFFIPILVSAFYFIIMLLTVIKNDNNYDRGDRNTVLIILLLPVLALFVQIVFPGATILWNMVALSLLLYYIFLRELQFTYDIQTDVKNRFSFEKEMKRLKMLNKNAVICVFDLNNLKSTNDKYGHKEGDELLSTAASIIKSCFLEIGKTYRIGGDEFCVICCEATESSANQAITLLENAICLLNDKRNLKLDLAHGYAVSNIDADENVYSAFTRADAEMYKNKAILKQQIHFLS